MQVFRPSSPNFDTAPHEGNAVPSSAHETPRNAPQPSKVSGNRPATTKATRTPTLTRLKTQLSWRNLREGKSSASEPPAGSAVSGSRSSPFSSFFTSPFGREAKRLPTLEWAEETIADAKAMQVRAGDQKGFDLWLAERLQKSSKMEVARELQDSAQEVIDKQLAVEECRGLGKRFKEWVKEKKGEGATVFAIRQDVDNAKMQVSILREAAVQKAVGEGKNEDEARKNFDLQIMQDRTIIDAHVFINIRAWSKNDTSAVEQDGAREQEQQVTVQEARAQKRPVQDFYDRQLAELESDSSTIETLEGEAGAATDSGAPSDSETAAPVLSAKRQNREEQIAAAREALDMLPDALVSMGNMKLPNH